jgi:hypothetical protein
MASTKGVVTNALSSEDATKWLHNPFSIVESNCREYGTDFLIHATRLGVLSVFETNRCIKFSKSLQR